MMPGLIKGLHRSLESFGISHKPFASFLIGHTTTRFEWFRETNRGFWSVVRRRKKGLHARLTRA